MKAFSAIFKGILQELTKSLIRLASLRCISTKYSKFSERINRKIGSYDNDSKRYGMLNPSIIASSRCLVDWSNGRTKEATGKDFFYF